jgi:hypothetical protein
MLRLDSDPHGRDSFSNRRRARSDAPYLCYIARAELFRRFSRSGKGDSTTSAVSVAQLRAHLQSPALVAPH